MDWEGSRFLHHEQQVRLWRLVANLEPWRQASALILQMDSVAPQLCTSAKNEIILKNDGAYQISQNLR